MIALTLISVGLAENVGVVCVLLGLAVLAGIGGVAMFMRR